MNRESDVIVVGANVAGASTARELALRDLDVALVERLDGKEVGRRSCGDGIERYQFESMGVDIPKGDFILRDIPVAYLTSPDGKHRIKGEAAGIAMERYGLNQHLLSQALDAGARLLDGTRVTGPVVEEGRVVGVRCSPRGGEPLELRAPVTVDATGWRGSLRRAVPGDWSIAEEVPRHELAVAYREERRRPAPVRELRVEATLDFEVAPGGLFWIADRTELLVNVGIGVQLVPGVTSPRMALRERVLPRYPDLEGTEVLKAGGGIIPNRRPIDCPVGPGIVAVGDAACQVQPLTGSGIGPSMYAARLAAGAIATALEVTRRPGVEELWSYPVAYHRTYGVTQAVNQVLRESLQALTNEQLNRLFASKLVSGDELVAAARRGRLELGFLDKLRALGRLAGEPGLVKALRRMHSRMERARGVYEGYPEDPEGMEGWRERAASRF